MMGIGDEPALFKGKPDLGSVPWRGRKAITGDRDRLAQAVIVGLPIPRARHRQLRAKMRYHSIFTKPQVQ